MAGQFAHIILVNDLCSDGVRDTIPNLSESMRSALVDFLPFCRLGAVSPDCPALVGQDAATGWNGVMHYLRPADFIRFAVDKISLMRPAEPDTQACIAWLFGYVAHVVTDYTIHPVVFEVVGDYKTHKPQHRLCELNQDVYLFSKKYGGKILRETDFKEFTGLAKCSVRGNAHDLHPGVRTLWQGCLEKYPDGEVHRYVRVRTITDDIDVWYATYVAVMQHFAVKGGHLLQRWSVAYPDVADPQYVHQLPVPNSTEMIDYDNLFELTKTKVINEWGNLALALQTNDSNRFSLANADLDTGIIAGTTQSVYWS